MATILPFYAVRPNETYVEQVAALPYDVYNREEAKKEIQGKPYSFLRIDRAETTCGDEVDTYAKEVYNKAKELLDTMISQAIFMKEKKRCYYIYELIMEGRSQTGIVACSSIDDYENNLIKKHELTREEKEQDRINHVDTCNAQTGPIFLAYRSNDIINGVVEETKKEVPIFDFTSEDGILHRGWRIESEDNVHKIYEAFSSIQDIYIADGHHRAASAVKVGLKRRRENPNNTGKEEYNYFLSVLFPDYQLKILPYNRAVRDLNGYSTEEFLNKISEKFRIQCNGTSPVEPKKKGCFGMYLEGQWYELCIKECYKQEEDPVQSLDVALLQRELLQPILGIEDPRTDKRIDFIGGIRGVGELERRVLHDMKVAFSMYPTSIKELFEVADANQLMPPKSTWFEPKLRSGLFIHEL